MPLSLSPGSTPPPACEAACALRPGGLALTDEALTLCPLPAGALVLDVGCGPGATVEHLRAHYGLMAFGLDLSAAALREGARPGVIQAAGEHLPVVSGQLEAVLAECSLSAMADPGRVLDECARVLKPGGALIATDVYARQPAGAEALRQLPPETGLSGARPQAEIIEEVQARGFAIVLWQDRSDVLKQLAVQLIMSHGSLPAYWGQAASPAAAPEIKRATALARPGYYLLVARKGKA